MVGNFRLLPVSVGGLFEQNTTGLILAAAILMLFVAFRILTPDGGQIKSVWLSFVSYNFGRAARPAPVSRT